MPFGGGRTQAVNVSGLIWDANLIVPAGFLITVDHIAETTGAHGVYINNILRAIEAHHDHIAEQTGAHGIVTDNNLYCAGDVNVGAASALMVNHIWERSAGHNIVFDNNSEYTGMMIGVNSNAVNLADSTTYYFGIGAYTGLSTFALLNRIFFAKDGAIRRADINWYESTAGTNENVSMYIRLNDTTDTLIQTLGAAGNKTFTNAALTIAVAAGDFIELKIITPAWATNPLGVAVGGAVYVG